MRNSGLWARRGALAFMLLACWPRLAGGQAEPARTAVADVASTLQPPNRLTAQPRDLQWYHLTAGLAAVGLAALADEGLRNTLQNHRSGTKDDIASVFRRMGQVEVFGTVGLGTIAAGIIAGNPKLRRAGERISAGMLVAAFVNMGFKESVGRHRPTNPTDAFRFSPFSGNDSWPSGHTTMAFALATGVADEVHSTPATIGLYTAATLTAWSRLNDDKHWLSDVTMGALVGITGAKLMNGHWRVLGIHAPRFLLEPGAVGVSLKF